MRKLAGLLETGDAAFLALSFVTKELWRSTTPFLTLYSRSVTFDWMGSRRLENQLRFWRVECPEWACANVGSGAAPTSNGFPSITYPNP